LFAATSSFRETFRHHMLNRIFARRSDLNSLR
jgi:hypothetical protein